MLLESSSPAIFLEEMLDGLKHGGLPTKSNGENMDAKSGKLDSSVHSVPCDPDDSPPLLALL
jgi:hypothetical protein